MTLDLKTEAERRREAEHQLIVSLYLMYKSNEQTKGLSDYRIFCAIARNPNVSINTAAGVRRVLVENGVYANKR